MRVFGRAILLKAAFVVMSCDSPIVEDDPWEPEPELLSEAESAEVATAFVDAACFCQAFLGMNYGTDSHVHSQLKDIELAAFEARESLGACTLSSGSPHARLPTTSERLGQVDRMHRNACAQPYSIERDAGSANAEMGLCAAEINHCIGQELRLKAQSLARPPSSAAVAAELMRRARLRLDRSAIEWVSGLRYLERACPTAPTGSALRGQCDLLNADGYELGRTLTARAAQAVAASIELLPLEVQARAAISDALAPSATGSATVLRRTWSRTQGERFLAAAAIAGDADAEVIADEVYRSDLTIDRGAADFAYAGRLHRDSRALELLSLIMEFEIPVSIGSTPGGTPRPYSVREPYPAPGTVAGIYHLLDHRIAAARYESIYAGEYESASPPSSLPGTPLRERSPVTGEQLLDFGVDDPADPDDVGPLSPDESPLHQLGISELDVQAALDLTYDLVTTTWTEWEGVRQVTNLGGIDLFAIRAHTPERRPALVLASILSRASSWVHADATARTEHLSHTPLSAQTEFYEPSPLHIAGLGANGRLHLLRVLLRRAATTSGNYLERSVAGEIARSIEQSIGHYWTETNRLTVANACTAVGAPIGSECLGDSSACRYCGPSGALWSESTSLLWTLYYVPGSADAQTFANGEPVAVRTEAEARCLLMGSSPGTGPGVCQTPTLTVLNAYGSPSNVIGVRRARFLLPNAATYATPTHLLSSRTSARAWILWRVSNGGRQQYSLIDVVHPRLSSEVHAFGGLFTSLLAETLEVDRSDLGRPAYTSFGVPFGLIPPLENAITSDGAAVEDSWAHYLADAEEAAVLARDLLAAAQTEEIRAIREVREDAVDRESAEVGALESLAAICGSESTESGCSFPGHANTTLRELGLVDAAGTPPAASTLPRGVACAALTVEDVVAVMRATGSAGEWPAVLRGRLRPILDCAYWNALTDAGSVYLAEVPEPVIAALADESTTPDFAEYQGVLREVMIALYGALVRIREAMYHLEQRYSVALEQVEHAAQDIDNIRQQDIEVVSCVAEQVVSTIASAISAAGSAQNLGDYWQSTGGPTGDTWSSARAEGYSSSLASDLRGLGSDARGVISAGYSCNSGNRLASRVARASVMDIAITVGEMARQADLARLAVGDAARASSTMRALRRDAELALARYRVESHATASDATEDSPSFAALQSVTRRRARGALSRAQVMSFVARRAIEARTVEDMRFMSASEALVAPPATWQGSVHTAPFATERGASGTHVSVSWAAIEDYVLNLGDLVRGYPQRRPFVAGTDTTVLDVRHAAEEGGLSAGTVFWCDGAPVVPAGPTLSPPCSSPERLDVLFQLGESSAYVRSRIPAGNFNHRVESVAINLLGAGVIDCSRAAREHECLTDASLQYSLEQYGSVFLESASGDHRLFEFGEGRIQVARALAAERHLGIPLSSADSVLISPFLRPELRGRPLFTRYQLTVYGRPEIRWERVEGIQILVRYRYWSTSERR